MTDAKTTLRQGEKRLVTCTITAVVDDVLIRPPDPLVSLYRPDGTAVFENLTATNWDTSPAPTVDVVHLLDSRWLDPGAYTLVFTVNAIGSSAIDPIFEPSIAIQIIPRVETGIASSARWLRNVLDDENAAAYYWSDAEISRYLEEFRESVQPWEPDTYNPSLHAVAYWSQTAGPFGYARYKPESLLLPSPDYVRWQAQAGYRAWVETQDPVIFVNGLEAIAQGFTFDVDFLAGSVSFTSGRVLTRNDVVLAAYDHYRVYESAYAALLVALGQWGAVQSISTSTSKVTRARLEDNLRRVWQLRRLGNQRSKPTYRRMA